MPTKFPSATPKVPWPHTKKSKVKCGAKKILGNPLHAPDNLPLLTNFEGLYSVIFSPVNFLIKANYCFMQLINYH